MEALLRTGLHEMLYVSSFFFIYTFCIVQCIYVLLNQNQFALFIRSVTTVEITLQRQCENCRHYKVHLEQYFYEALNCSSGMTR